MIGIIVFLIVWWIVANKFKAHKAELQAEQDMKYKVQTWDIKVQVKVTAIVNLVDEQNLSFGQEDKIMAVYTEVGDQVHSWDILAELNMDDYHNAIQTAELDFANVQLTLQKLLNNDTSLIQAQIRSKINEAKLSYNIEFEELKVLEQKHNTILQQKMDQLEQLGRDYQLAQRSLEVAVSWLIISIQTETEQTESTLQSRQQTIDSIINTLRSSLGDAEFVIESVDRIFGVSKTFENNIAGYGNNLSAKNTQLKQETNQLIRNAYILVANFRTQINTLSDDSSDDEIYTLIQDFYENAEILVTLCDIALDALDMSVQSTVLSSTKLQWFSATIGTARINATTLRTQLQALASSVNSLFSDAVSQGQLAVSINQKQIEYTQQRLLLTKTEEDIRLLTNEIEILKKDLPNQLSRKQAQITTLNEKIHVAQKELSDILDGPDDYDIQQQKNLVGQAQLRLEKIKDQQDHYQIIAEFDGRVRTVDIIEGEQFKLDDRKFIIIENPNLIELKLQVSQIDIVKIKEWDPVIVTFDSYPNDPIKASITSRNVNPEFNTRWGIYYEVIIILQKQDLEILAGMTALVEVTTAEVQNVLIVPTLALVHNGQAYVYLMENNEYSTHPVEVGITNNFQAEIISWLTKWDIIKASALDEEILKEMWIDDSSSSIF